MKPMGQRPEMAELRTVGRALRQRWPLTPERREEMMEELQLMALNAGDDRIRLRAIELMGKLDELNLKDEVAQAEIAAIRGTQIIEVTPEQVEEIGSTVEGLLSSPVPEPEEK